MLIQIHIVISKRELRRDQKQIVTDVPRPR